MPTLSLTVNSNLTDPVFGASKVLDALAVVPSHLMKVPSYDFSLEKNVTAPEALYSISGSITDQLVEISSMKAHVASSIGRHFVEIRQPATVDVSSLVLDGEYSIWIEIVFGYDVPTTLNINYGLSSEPALNGLKVATFSKANNVISGFTAEPVRDVENELKGHGVSDNGVTRVSYPRGASFKGGAITTGALKVTLPVSWTSTMMKFVISVYDYDASDSYDVMVQGDNDQATSSWVNANAFVISDTKTLKTVPVSFSHDGQNCCLIIGDIANELNHVHVIVKGVEVSQSSFDLSTWSDGWSIGAIGSLTGITTTVTIDADHVGATINGVPVVTDSSPRLLDPTDALRASGDSIILAKADGTTESVAFVATASARALHSTDALRASGISLQLVRGNGASEFIAVSDLIKNIAVNSIGSYCFAKRLVGSTVQGGLVAGSSLYYSNTGDVYSGTLAGTWRCMGRTVDGAGETTLWLRVS